MVYCRVDALTLPGHAPRRNVPMSPAKDYPDVNEEDTRLESVEDILQAPPGRRTPTGKKDETILFRPLHRASVACLCILDDGSKDQGEWLRVRHERLVIGRSEGDVLIPHDAMMSSRHAELTRQVRGDKCPWYLTDLDSTNGTFVRVSDSVLRHRQELFIGGRRYRLEAPVAAERAHAARGAGTRPWQNAPAATACLVEVTPQGDGQRYALDEADNWIGRDRQSCNVVIAEDLLVSPRHARLYWVKHKNHWAVENARSLNGVWVRIRRIPVEGHGSFQLGEQRFLVKVY